MGVPTSPSCGEEGSGDALGCELTMGVPERCGAGLVNCRCRADTVRGRPDGQERCGDGGLGFRLAKMRSGPDELPASESALGIWLLVVWRCAEIRRGFRQVSPPCIAYFPEKREFRRGCRRVSPSCVTYCPERRGEFRCGCRRVSPNVQPIVRRSAVGCLFSCW